MLPEKLPTLTKRGEVLTEKEWEYYFECRKKYDKPVSEKRKLELIDAMCALNPCDPANDKMIFEIGSQIPCPVNVALAIKEAQGLKNLCEFNLYEAKKACPEDF